MNLRRLFLLSQAALLLASPLKSSFAGYEEVLSTAGNLAAKGAASAWQYYQTPEGQQCAHVVGEVSSNIFAQYANYMTPCLKPATSFAEAMANLTCYRLMQIFRPSELEKLNKTQFHGVARSPYDPAQYFSEAEIVNPKMLTPVPMQSPFAHQALLFREPGSNSLVFYFPQGRPDLTIALPDSKFGINPFKLVQGKEHLIDGHISTVFVAIAKDRVKNKIDVLAQDKSTFQSTTIDNLSKNQFVMPLFFSSRVIGFELPQYLVINQTEDIDDSRSSYEDNICNSFLPFYTEYKSPRETVQVIDFDKIMKMRLKAKKQK